MNERRDVKTIEVSEENYAALEDQLDPDIKTHDNVISGLFDLIDQLIRKNADLKTRAERLDTP